MDWQEVDELREHARVLVRELDLLQGPQKTFGGSLSECHLIQLIRAAPGITASKLAVDLNLDKSTTSRLVNSTIKKGWVASEEDRADRRRSLLSLTKQGQRVAGKIDAAARSQISEALSLLSVAERAAVLGGLQLYAGALREIRKRKAGKD